MAARRLKFRPKPTITNLVRRGRDKEDLPNPIQNEEIIVPESTVARDGPIYSVIKNENLHLDADNSNGQIVEQLKTEPNSNEFPYSDEIVEPVFIGPLLHNPIERLLCNENGCENILPNKQSSVQNLELSDQYRVPPVTLNNGNGLASANVKSNRSLNTNFVDSCKYTEGEVSSNNCNLSTCYTSAITESDPLTEDISNNSISKDLKRESDVGLDSSKKTSSVKAFSRFGRSRCKPVLNSNSLRKKSDMVESVESPSNVAVTRTDSVIKSLQSELSKINKCLNEDIDNSDSLEIDKQQSCEKDQSNTILPQKCVENNDVYNTTNKNGRRNIILSRVNDFLNSSSIRADSAKKINVDEVPVSSNQVAKIENISVDNINCKSKNTIPTNEDDSVIVIEHSITKSPSNNKVPVSPIRPASKILGPKPSPRLTDATSRRISFQGSDSEDDNKKRTSTVKENSKELKDSKKEKKMRASKRKRSQGPTYSKLGQDTMRELSKKIKDGVDGPDKNKLTMLDLIFYNPKTNPMSVNPNKTAPQNKKGSNFEVSQTLEETLEEQEVDDVEPAVGALPVPQLKVGPDGQVMLDPESLVIETTGMNKNKEQLEKSQVVYESGITRYNTYSKRKNKRSEWTPHETLQFYRALSTIGSDFSLMTQLFPKRTRHDLKLKFKREERVNMHLIDKAMTIRSSFDFKTLESEIKKENEEIERKNREKQLAKEAAKKQRALKKEMKNKDKKKVADRNIRIKYCALKEFSEEEVQSLYEKKPKTRKKKSKNKAISLADTDDEDVFKEKALAPISRVVNLVADIHRNRNRFRNSEKALNECEEMNETLKKNLELKSRMEEDGIIGKKVDSEPESEEDVYTPNCLSAYMLYGSPEKGPLDPDEEELTHEESEPQWNIEIQSLPAIEETVMVENIEEVSELSELGSFGQNDIALDLSIPVHSNLSSEVLKRSQMKHSLLDRHLISESIQIIDQLTSTDTTDSCDYIEEKPVQRSYPEEMQVEDYTDDSRYRLPSFESVSSRPSIAYSLLVPNDSSSYGVQEPEVHVEKSVQESHEDRTHANVFFPNFYRETEECILGD